MISESKIKEIVRSVLEEAYSEKLIQQLIDRFKEEHPDLDDSLIRAYIDRFQQIKNSPKVENKDITTYSWDNLREIVDYNQPDDIKIEGGGKLIYDQNDLKIYLANSKQACVKYGTGYNFCISSRGSDNLYHNYRFGKDGITSSSIYFVEDEDLSHEQDETGEFRDPTHLLVIMVSTINGFTKKTHPDDPDAGKTIYKVTTADNLGEKKFNSIDDVAKFYQPKLRGLGYLFKDIKPNPKEKKYKEIQENFDNQLIQLFQQSGIKFNPNTGVIPFMLEDLMNKTMRQVFSNYLNNQPNFNYSFPTYEAEELPIKIYPTKIDPVYYLEWLHSDLDYDVTSEDVDEVEIIPVLPSDPKYMNYLQQVKKIYGDFLHEKNKLNIGL